MVQQLPLRCIVLFKHYKSLDLILQGSQYQLWILSQFGNNVGRSLGIQERLQLLLLPACTTVGVYQYDPYRDNTINPHSYQTT